MAAKQVITKADIGNGMLIVLLLATDANGRRLRDLQLQGQRDPP